MREAVMSAKRPETEKVGNVPPFGLRMLPRLKQRVEWAAAANNRSLNAEIVTRLEATFGDPAAPAFPEHTFHVVPGFGMHHTASGGMSLRDWFAGQALPGISFDCGLSVQEAAERAYELADAMLAQREKR
jgi:hypothetical protein